MTESPWLTPEQLKLANWILKSHQVAFKRPLFAHHNYQIPNRTISQELFALSQPVIAHDSSQDPLLNYINATALQIWHRRWKEMIDMPSKLTAPIEEQKHRAIALSQAQNKSSVEGYRGVRINSRQQKFQINNARIWTIWNDEGTACGQAATFTSWWLI